MKRLLPLIIIMTSLAAYEETPIYPYGLELENETTLEEVDSYLSAEGWECEVLDEGLSLYAVRDGDAEIIYYWLDEDFLKEVSYSESWDDAWDGRERYGEWQAWLRLIHGKPMVDDETFHYWKLPGEEIWIEIVEPPDGTATLTFSLTFL